MNLKEEERKKESKKEIRTRKVETEQGEHMKRLPIEPGEQEFWAFGPERETFEGEIAFGGNCCFRSRALPHAGYMRVLCLQ